jgi:hypothetical protein
MPQVWPTPAPGGDVRGRGVCRVVSCRLRGWNGREPLVIPTPCRWNRLPRRRALLVLRVQVLPALDWKAPLRPSDILIGTTYTGIGKFG